MPLVQTRGAASAQGFGEFAQVTAVNYIEDVFSTYLYTGTGASLTITNNIDLSTKGGLTWIKGRSGATGHRLTDTARGVTKSLESNSTAAEATESTGLTAFNTTGFTIGADADYNTSSATYASWTFRKQPKFFDIVTYTGTGSNRTIAHNLGSEPGCIIVKRTDTAGFDWPVYHRSTGNTKRLLLNDTVAAAVDSGFWNNTTPTSSVFSLGSNVNTNGSGGTYVAYLFAHDAGGFGLTGLDNVISCGTFTTDGSGNATVSLGYEPQWVLYKGASGTGGVSGWILADTMRGYAFSGGKYLAPNSNQTEGGLAGNPTATGFVVSDTINTTWIYIAIRRGPMKVPTLGTTVYNAIARSGNSTSTTFTGVGFVPDLTSVCARSTTSGFIWQDRLRGATYPMFPAITQVETNYANEVTAINQDGITVGTDTPVNQTGVTYINHFFGRAPSFFDEVCYTGTGTSGQTYSHNLGAVPELMIVKCRAGGAHNWEVWHKSLSSASQILRLNNASSETTSSGAFNSTAPTSSVFTVGNNFSTNGGSGYTYVNYLFATCAGVSKVGSFTGNGTTQTIDCGFGASGARFVIIKRFDSGSTGNWYVYDTVRGMTVLTDPYLWLDSVNGEVATLGSVTAVSTGFALNAAIVAAINVNAGTYIFLAIA